MLPRRAYVALRSARLALPALVSVMSMAGCVLITEIDYDLIRDDDTQDAGSDAPAPECQTAADCDDQAPCTVDECNASQCSHTPAPEGTMCAPSTPCVATFACNNQGACTQTPITLDDGNICTADSCDPATGAISHEPKGAGCIAWEPLPTQDAPSGRYNHAAVWTGSQMIIWGGEAPGAPAPLGDGGVYDPKTKTWKPINTQGAPTARFGHRAVWTGTRMIVWGGYGESGLASGGGMYDPAQDQWYPVAIAQAPTPRLLFSAVWTGTRMVVWGGLAGMSVLNTGGIYDPATNLWSTLPTAGAPSHRFSHSATWTGTKMVVFGGYDLFDWFNDGGVYSNGGVWSGKTATQNAPPTRESHTALWTGSEILIWGGWNGGPFLDTGAIFEPDNGANGTWTSMSTVNAPSPRWKHIAAWTGSEMVVWGGCGDDGCATIHGNGGRYVKGPNGGTWTPVPEVETLSPRKEATSVWTGSELIVWGGRGPQGVLNTGASAAL